MKCACCRSTEIIPRPFGLDHYYGCIGCGFLFRSREGISDVRYDLINHYQEIDPHETVALSKQGFFNASLKYLSSQIRHRRNSLLDVGCGYGYFLELAMEQGWQVSGIEISGKAVRAARDKVGDKNIFHGSLIEAKYPDDSFDVVTLWDMLDMSEDPFEELRECYRIMKNGGKIGIRVRNASFQKLLFRLFRPVLGITARLGIKHPFVFHLYCFTPASIYQLLCRAGFARIRITNSPLTEGDPYGYSRTGWATRIVKRMVYLFSRDVFRVTDGLRIIGPSLLVWAEKPS